MPLDFEIRLAGLAGEALALVARDPVDLVLTEWSLPDGSGLDLMRRLLDGDAELPCIVMTRADAPDQSLAALRAGAFWYLEKPLTAASFDLVRKLAVQAVDQRRLRVENRELKSLAPVVPSTGLDLHAVVTRFENDLIEQALERTDWNKNRAAGLLGLNRTTLLEKIKRRGLQPRRPHA